MGLLAAAVLALTATGGQLAGSVGAALILDLGGHADGLFWGLGLAGGLLLLWYAGRTLYVLLKHPENRVRQSATL